MAHIWLNRLPSTNVLKGIGQFTILDPATVEEADLGVNFFLDEQSLGKSRAEENCKFLQELNPDVKGHFLSEVSLARLLPCGRLANGSSL